MNLTFDWAFVFAQLEELVRTELGDAQAFFVATRYNRDYFPIPGHAKIRMSKRWLSVGGVDMHYSCGFSKSMGMVVWGIK